MNPILPSDCHRRIVTFLDPGHLYTYLTVNKDTFSQVAACLWYDPFSHVRKSPKATKALIKTILALSPLDDEEINQLREHLGLRRSTTDQSKAVENDPFQLTPIQPHPSASTTPTIDYLSLIKVVSLTPPEVRALSMIRSIELKPEGPYCNLVDALTWAVYAHQLDKIKEITIQGDSIERYILAAPHMKNIERIQIYFAEKKQQQYYSDACRLVQAIQMHHGREQLRDCRSTTNPLSDRTNDRKELVECALKLYRLLPPFYDKYHPDQVWVRPVGNLLDADLNRLTRLTTCPKLWELFGQLAPERARQEFLERCRQLQWLHAMIDVGDLSLFRWADNERKQRRMGHRVKQPAPISQLVLTKLPGGDFKPVEEGIRAFCQTLKSVEVHCTSSSHLDYDIDTAVPFINLAVATFPQLEHLVLDSHQLVDVDAYLLDRCPVLKTLFLRLGNALHEDDSLGTNWPKLTLMPSLVKVELVGRATWLFDPASLSSAEHLESLTVEWPQELLPFSGNERLALGLHGLLAKRWLWNWPLLNLTSLKVGNLREDYHFSFNILFLCPRLQTLFLSSEPLERSTSNNRDSHENETNVNTEQQNAPAADANADAVADANATTATTDTSENEELGDHFYELRVREAGLMGHGWEANRSCNLQELELRGSWLIARDEVSHLLHVVLPRLLRLRLERLNFLSVDEWVNVTRTHPTLRFIRVDSIGVMPTAYLSPSLRWVETLTQLSVSRTKAYSFGGARYDLIH